MFWFESSIRSAVDKVKSSGGFLLVFVQGEDNLSKKYETYLNGETKFKEEDFVAIKIPNNSVAYQQFKEIYVSVPIPSVFLIQNNGIPLSIVSSNETSDLQNAINNAVNKQKTKQEIKNKTQSKKEPLCEDENKSSKPAQANPLQHVKDIGRRLTDISEEEIKKRLKEIRAFPRFWLMDSPDTNEITSNRSLPAPQKSARIQFRLPNNTMPSWEFPDMSTLGDVRAYLMEKVKLSPNFKLLRTYPRSSFNPQDELKTLSELSLTPSATLIVVPIADKTVQAKVKSLMVQRSLLSTLLNTLLWPLFTILNYFKKNVFNNRSDGEEVEPERVPSDTAFEKAFNKKTSTSNIHGFKFEEDTDTDTEHPDNGNSTQQRFQK